MEVPQEGGTRLPCDGLFMLPAALFVSIDWNSAWAAAAPSPVGLHQCLALSLHLRLLLGGSVVSWQPWLPESRDPKERRSTSDLSSHFPGFCFVLLTSVQEEESFSRVEMTSPLPHCVSLSVSLCPTSASAAAASSVYN